MVGEGIQLFKIALRYLWQTFLKFYFIEIGYYDVNEIGFNEHSP